MEDPKSNDIPRRARLDQFTRAERAIYDAAQAVEDGPADVRLTDAVILLQAARDSVADFVDGIDKRRHVVDEVGRAILDERNSAWKAAADWRDQLAAVMAVRDAEREMLHAIIADCNSLIDPEQHGDLNARINAVLLPCDEAGKCVPPTSDHRQARTWTGFHPARIQELGLIVDRKDFYVRDASTREVRLMTDAEWADAMGAAKPEYVRCICGFPGDTATCPVDHDEIRHEGDDPYAAPRPGQEQPAQEGRDELRFAAEALVRGWRTDVSAPTFIELMDKLRASLL
jgi:hypothetical protein